MDNFKNHKIAKHTKADGFEYVLFREMADDKDTDPIGIGYMEFILYRSQLVVMGDYGYAIYRFSLPPITFKGLATLNIDYFKSKCEASEVGRTFLSGMMISGMKI